MLKELEVAANAADLLMPTTNGVIADLPVTNDINATLPDDDNQSSDESSSNDSKIIQVNFGQSKIKKNDKKFEKVRKLKIRKSIARQVQAATQSQVKNLALLLEAQRKLDSGHLLRDHIDLEEKVSIGSLVSLKVSVFHNYLIVIKLLYNSNRFLLVR